LSTKLSFASFADLGKTVLCLCIGYHYCFLGYCFKVNAISLLDIEANRHTARYTGPVSVVSQCKIWCLAEGLRKRRSVPPYGP